MSLIIHIMFMFAESLVNIIIEVNAYFTDKKYLNL